MNIKRKILEDVHRKPMQQGLSTPVAGLHPGGLDLVLMFHPFVSSVTHQDARVPWLLWLLSLVKSVCRDIF